MLTQLEEKIQYKFSNLKLLEEALTHPSIKRISKTSFSYERLECLGDKVLGLIVCDLLLEAYPKENEGAISKRQASIVCKQSLFEIAKSIDLGNFLILTQNQEHDGGRSSESILENALEALIGSIYKDGGLAHAKNFISRIFGERLQNTNANPPQDAKSAFQEYFQKKYKKLPVYDVAPTKEGKFEASLDFKNKQIKAIGRSIKEAEKLVAKLALKEIKPLASFD